MKLKNYKAFASVAALMIIGLLVMTGCQGLFDPPIRPSADGSGTLLLSVNGADGRTILPAAAVDDYKLELYEGEDATQVPYEGAYPPSLKGSTALELPAGTYRLIVKGYVDGEAIAQGEKQNIVIAAGSAVAVSIILEPAEEGEGTFSWDFTAAQGVTSSAIAIYAIDDDATVVEQSSAKADDITLDAGVYNVKFTVDDKTWWEILYIYAGLTSKYGISELVDREIIAPIYQVPAEGPGYFYLNLNNWQTQTPSSAGINDVVPEGELTADALTVTFTQNNQRINVKLTNSQVYALLASKALAVTITGSVGESTTTFRYHMGNALSGLNWNATSTDVGGSIAGLISETGITRALAYGPNKNVATVGYFILQQREGVETEITINSIRIDYPIDPESDGFFDMDLSDWETQTPEDANINSTVPQGTLTADGLTLKFTENNQRVNIALTEAQIDLLNNDEIATVAVTITGDVGDSTTTFRYHLGNALSGANWNATGTDVAGSIAGLISETGATKELTFSGYKSPVTLGYFILQQRAAVETSITIKSIRIEFKFKQPVPCNCTTGEFDCTDDPFMIGCTGDCECPKPGEPADLGNYPGLKQSGGPKIHLLDDGGLFFYDRPNDYSCLDLDFEGLTLDAAAYYRVTVAGRAKVAANALIQIAQAGSPYGVLGSQALSLYGATGSVITFRYDLTEKTGAELTEAGVRIRVYISASDFPNFIIDGVELIKLDGIDGADVGDSLILFGEIPDAFYLVPADGENLFFLDLNDWETVSTSEGGLDATKVTGTVGMNNLKVGFTKNNQRLNIGLTDKQKAVLQNAATVTITIDGAADPDTSFRWHLGDPSLGGGWNATGSFDALVFSELSEGKEVAVSTPNVATHFILQQRAEATTKVTIKSIKVAYEFNAEEIDVEQGTVLNFNDIDGLTGAGNPTFKLLDDGGILVAGRTANWNAIDLVLAATSTEGAILVEADTYYRLTVKGKSVATADNAAEIVQADGPYANFKVEPLLGFGGVGKIVSFTVSVTDKTGGELLASRTRIRTSDTAPYILDSVELIKLDGKDGAAVGVPVFAYNLPEVIDVTGTVLANLNDISGIQQAGGPKYNLLEDGGLAVYNRVNNWDGVDLQLFLEAKEDESWRVVVDADTYYRLTVKGRAVANGDMAIQIVQGGSPYGQFKVTKLTEFGAAGKIVEFTAEVTNQKGSTLQSPNVRIRVQPGDSGPFPDFIIDSIELIALDKEDGDDVGEALIAFNLE